MKIQEADQIVHEFTMGMETTGVNELLEFRLEEEAHENPLYAVTTVTGTGGRSRARREPRTFLAMSARGIGEITGREIQRDKCGPDGIPTSVMRAAAHEFLLGMEQEGLVDAGSLRVSQIPAGMVIAARYPGGREHQREARTDSQNVGELGRSAARAMIQEATRAAIGWKPA